MNANQLQNSYFKALKLFAKKKNKKTQDHVKPAVGRACEVKKIYIFKDNLLLLM